MSILEMFYGCELAESLSSSVANQDLGEIDKDSRPGAILDVAIETIAAALDPKDARLVDAVYGLSSGKPVAVHPGTRDDLARIQRELRRPKS